MTTCITAVWPYYLPLSSQGVLGKTLVWINQSAYLKGGTATPPHPSGCPRHNDEGSEKRPVVQPPHKP